MMALPHFLAGGGEIGALMRAKSWSDTLLGAPETWPDVLKMAVSICLNSRFPITLWWGPELVMLYNDAWRPVLRKTKHPVALGRPGSGQAALHRFESLDVRQRDLEGGIEPGGRRRRDR
jgi:hypothetical protein